MNTPTGSFEFTPPICYVPAVERALKLLELCAASDGSLTLSDIGKALAIPKSSAHRLIYTLLGRGYLQRTSNARCYILGTCARDLAKSMTDADLRLAAVCSPFSEDLSKRTGLSALTGIRRGIEGVVIQKCILPQDLFPGAIIGHHFDLHCTAMGKALIAYLPEPEVEEMFQKIGFPRYTETTISSLKQLKADITGVRACGFSLNNGELTLGGRGLAAPIFDHVGRVVASICVRGSTALFPAWRVSSCGKEVLAVSKEISRTLLEAMPVRI